METTILEKNKKSNKINFMLGILWQASIVLAPIYYIKGDHYKALIALFIFLIMSVVLKYTWFNKLKKH